jgi:hypothetical protein
MNLLEELGRSESGRPTSFPTDNYAATRCPLNATRYWLPTTGPVRMARNEDTAFVFARNVPGLSRRSKARSEERIAGSG